MENNAELTDHTFPLESKEYFEHLLGKSLADGEKFTTKDYEKIEEAYNKSHDIRKFEIELYWKRSTYFWTFISVLIAVCGGVSAGFFKDGKIAKELLSFLFCASVLGYFISLQFLVTCLSGKQWQENWERHIDILEPYFSGNLYKLNLVKGNIRHSISLSNEIIVLSITFVWFGISIYSMSYISVNFMLIGLAFIGITTGFYLWKSLKRSKNTDIDITFNIRRVKSTKIKNTKNYLSEKCHMKWANRIITGLVIALLTLIVVLLIGLVFYNTDKEMEIGSLTDWLIAIANIAMAITAIVTARKALHWFKDKAFTHSMTLLSKFDDVKLRLDLFHNNLIVNTSYQTEKYHSENFEQTTTKIQSVQDTEFDIEVINALETELAILYKEIAALNSAIHSTSRLGFEMDSELKTQITTAFSSYSNNAWVHLNYYKKPTGYILMTINNDGPGNDDKTVLLCTLKDQLNDAATLLKRDIKKSFKF
ncbi:LptF/LptG family permease [Serratia proteamaculans]|uniref:LptF/LptG family permease n=1 Tax=Serratia proteamaculans TaxID=28151 RepID=UPI00217B4B07|nr:LptF/LptG family permease [Serratia proteamaculans]CAI1979875.1 Uncharacterised protein [Serratia proteamaculans]